MSTESFHLDAEQIYKHINFPGLINALALMHREPAADLKDLLLEQQGETEKNYCLIRAAWQKGSGLGIKIASVFPSNQTIDLPAIHAAYVLFDGKTGVPTRSIDGTALTYLKTAADSALGSQLLAKPRSRNLLMVGAGAMAPYLIEAHCASNPTIDSVKVWNRSTGRRDKLVSDLSQKFAIEATDDLAQSAAWADIICSATMTCEPIILGQWLTAGTHVDLVGAFRKDMREADDQTLSHAKIFVDSRATTIEEIGELIIPIEKGVITKDDIRADLFELCSGVSGRRESSDITVFKNGGGGHLDLMTATYIEKCFRSIT